MNKSLLRITLFLFISFTMLLVQFPSVADAAGMRAWDKGKTITSEIKSTEDFTQLIRDKNDAMYAVWYEEYDQYVPESPYYLQNGARALYAARTDTQGNSVWGKAVHVGNIAATGNAVVPYVAADDGFIIIWTDNRNDRKLDVFAQKIDGNGKKVWGENGKPVYDGPGEQKIAYVIQDGYGGAIVVWDDDERLGLYAQRILPDGSMAWSKDGVSINDICAITQSEYDSNIKSEYESVSLNDLFKIAPDLQGGLYVSWTKLTHKQRNLSPERIEVLSSGSILAQRVSGNGSRAWPTNVSIEVRDVSIDMQSLDVASDDGNAYLSWRCYNGPAYEHYHTPDIPLEDLFVKDENPNMNIFAAKISKDGVIQWNPAGAVFSTGKIDGTITHVRPIVLSGGLLFMWQRSLYDPPTETNMLQDDIWLLMDEYAISDGCEMVRVDSDGSLAWRKRARFDILLGYSSSTSNLDVSYQPVLDASGGFFVPSAEMFMDLGNYRLHHFDKDGNPTWSDEGITFLKEDPDTTTGFHEAAPTFNGMLYDHANGVYCIVRNVTYYTTVTHGNGWTGWQDSPDLQKTNLKLQHIVDDGSGWRDVSISDWSYSYIKSMLERKAVAGYGDNNFKPERPATRAEFAKMVATVFELTSDTSGNAQPPKASGSAGSFTDAKAHWAGSYIDKAVAAKLMNGYPNGTFKPNAFINRAEACAIIARANRLSAIQGPIDYIDLPNTFWARGYIAALSKESIINGYPNKTFKPQSSISRAEAAKLIITANSSMGGVR